jgi:glycosyltransferase involved in cell wall biosynthesis
MRYTIIITTYNWHTALDLILEALLPQIKNRDNVEIIIADDGSGLETREVVNKYSNLFPLFQHIWHEDNGFRRSIIINKAVVAATGDYILFLDGDCIPLSDYVEQHIKLAQNGYFVGGNRVLLSQSYTTNIFANNEHLNQLYSASIFGYLKLHLQRKTNKWFSIKLRLSACHKLRYLRKKDWKVPKGCNFAVFKKDFVAVNGYNEGFIGWGYEDSDLFLRLMHYGILFKDGRYAATVLHLWHKSVPRPDTKMNPNYQQLLNTLNDSNIIYADNGIVKSKNIS